MGQMAQDILHESDFPELDKELHITDKLHEHQTGQFNHSELLWSALNYILWKKEYKI
jgi:hypothetical protein